MVSLPTIIKDDGSTGPFGDVELTCHELRANAACGGGASPHPFHDVMEAAGVASSSDRGRGVDAVE